MKPRASLVLLLLLGALTVLTACAKETPVAVTDLNASLGQARDACASVYAPEALAEIQPKADEMNRLVTDGKMKKARKQAEELATDVESLKTESEMARDAARKEAQQAVARAEEAVEAARRAEASKHASSGFSVAEAKLKQAMAAAGDPCAYGDAPALAREAIAAAEESRTMAIAEARRIAEEEARRREEEARRREQEEARRLAEEEARRHPPTYTVASGDCLWNISEMAKVYQNAILWPVIYDANRNQITDPDLIYPGQELTIPRQLTAEQMMKTVREMWAADLN